MIDQALDRARILIEHKRYKDAELELQKSLSYDPNNAETFSLLALCKLIQEKPKEAEPLIKNAISIDPTNSYNLYLLSKVQLDLGQIKEGEKTINEAIHINPYNAEFFGVLAIIYLNKREWAKALDFANKGLEISPDNLNCLNLRSTALIKLDKKEESYNTIKEALYYDPDNASTHTNLGWGLLENGDHKKALDHFKKALQLDPQSEFAKQGLVQALKARYLAYRLFLKYAFWIGNMKESAQWGVMIGFYIGSKFISVIADSYPFLMPIVYLYIAFAISTWVIAPLTNLFLRLNPYGRFALSSKEIITSNFIGASLLSGLIGFISYLFTSNDLWLGVTILGLSMMIPLSSMLRPEKRNSRLVLIAYSAGLLIVGLYGIALYILGNSSYSMMIGIYAIGIFLFQWVANVMIAR